MRTLQHEWRNLWFARGTRWIFILGLLSVVLFSGLTAVLPIEAGEVLSLTDLTPTTSVLLALLTYVLMIATVSQGRQGLSEQSALVEPRRGRLLVVRLALAVLVYTALMVATAVLTWVVVSAVGSAKGFAVDASGLLTWDGGFLGQWLSGLLSGLIALGLGMLIPSVGIAFAAFFLFSVIIDIAVGLLADFGQWVAVNDAIATLASGDYSSVEWPQTLTALFLGVVVPFAAGVWVFFRRDVR